MTLGSTGLTLVYRGRAARALRRADIACRRRPYGERATRWAGPIRTSHVTPPSHVLPATPTSFPRPPRHSRDPHVIPASLPPSHVIPATPTSRDPHVIPADAGTQNHKNNRLGFIRSIRLSFQSRRAGLKHPRRCSIKVSLQTYIACDTIAISNTCRGVN